jgi:hypothetical protein
MAERHETSTGFTTEPYTEVPLADMSPRVRNATGDLLSTAVSVHKFQYRHIDGTGSVVGLRASIESHLQTVLPRCDPVTCTMRAELCGAERTDPTSCTLALSCDPITGEIESEVDDLERTCLENHQLAVEGFKRYVLTTTQDITRVKAEISTANKNIATNEAYLRSIT